MLIGGYNQKDTKLLDFHRIFNNSVSFFIMRFCACGHEKPVFLQKTGIFPQARPPLRISRFFTQEGAAVFWSEVTEI